MNFLRGLGTAVVTFLALVGAIVIFFFVTCLVMSSIPPNRP